MRAWILPAFCAFALVMLAPTAMSLAAAGLVATWPTSGRSFDGGSLDVELNAIDAEPYRAFVGTLSISPVARQETAWWLDVSGNSYTRLSLPMPHAYEEVVVRWTVNGTSTEQMIIVAIPEGHSAHLYLQFVTDASGATHVEQDWAHTIVPQYANARLQAAATAGVLALAIIAASLFKARARWTMTMYLAMVAFIFLAAPLIPLAGWQFGLVTACVALAAIQRQHDARDALPRRPSNPGDDAELPVIASPEKP